MRTALWTGAILTTLAVMFMLGGCGDTDPAKAMYGATVTNSPESISYTVTCAKGQVVTFEDEFIITSLVVGEDAVPMNGTEVRWIPRFPGVSLYLPEDDVNAVDPLETPFSDETDDRGISEIKVLINFAMLCGGTTEGYISTDIGVASSQTTLTYNATEQAGGDDDDDDTE